MQEIIVKLQMGTDGSHSRINPYLTWLNHHNCIWRLEETGKLHTCQISEQTNLICISLAYSILEYVYILDYRFFWILYILRLRNAHHMDNSLYFKLQRDCLWSNRQNTTYKSPFANLFKLFFAYNNWKGKK